MRKLPINLAGVVCGVAVCLVSWPSLASALCANPVAEIVSAQGSVELNKAPAKLADAICPGDVIKVGSRSRAAIVILETDTVLRIDQDTELRTRSVSPEGVSLLDLLQGAINLLTPAPRSLEIKTPVVNAAVEGTEFYMRVEADRAVITVFEGRVTATNDFGSLSLHGGQSAVARAGKAPEQRIVVRPRDAVQWALHYPTIGVDEKTSALTREAADLLVVGRVEEATKRLDQARSENANDAVAVALQAMIAIAQNRDEEAMRLAQQAVNIDPGSSTAYTALSYVQQSKFDIDGALESARQAADRDPNNAYAWARLAELQSSKGDLKASLVSAEKAVTIDPSISRTQTVLGFAHLTRIEMAKAQEIFNKAIALNSEDPLPRLGLGLATIRKGDLSDGRRDIEIAASLDSNNSLVRSYLGKAYYEEKRDEVAGVQYDLAKELDPKDPTPWFYHSIQLQSGNRPVDALHNQQQAIARNDNRLVYRSRLLLDKDLAARNVALGRIYNDLTIEELGIIHATSALAIDPGNHSAHRLLADSYFGKANLDAARHSELLQSKLTQPLSLDPLQPQLNKSNLGLLDGSGPGNISYHEYNPLFTRNGFALQVDGAVAEQDTWGEDIVLAGLRDRFAFSLGQYHTETDGFRPNTDYGQDIYSVFTQISVSPELSFQIEVNHEEEDKGDVALRLLPELLSIPTLRVNTETTSYRAGATYEFSPSTAMRISTIQRENDFLQLANREGFETTLEIDEDIDLHDIQLQHSLPGHTLLTGASYNRHESNSLLVIDPCPLPPLCQTTASLSENQGRVYGYYFFEPVNTVRLTAGATIAQDDSKLFDSEDTLLLPKFGAHWSMNDNTTIRSAVFRNVSASTTASLYQTLEPTHVAGFNQIFDEFRQTRSWNFGLAVDRQLSPGIQYGAHALYRDGETPFSITDTRSLPPITTVADVESTDKSAELWLSWFPSDDLGISVSYRYDDYETAENIDIEGVQGLAPDGVVSLKTHHVPIALNYYHASGWSTRLNIGYYDQRGRFVSDVLGVAQQEADDSFWLVDWVASYRLPKRRGMISFGAKNLLDDSFRFEDRDSYDALGFRSTARPSSLSESRLFFAQVSLNFR